MANKRPAVVLLLPSQKRFHVVFFSPSKCVFLEFLDKLTTFFQGLQDYVDRTNIDVEFLLGFFFAFLVENASNVKYTHPDLYFLIGMVI